LAAPNGYDSNNRRLNIFNPRKSGIDSNETQYRRENSEVVRLDRAAPAGRERTERDGNGDSEGGSSNRQGDTVRHSRRIIDSDGVLLTEEQAEYFKDSKIRDENGNLLVLYHGSKADATVFKEEFISSWKRLTMNEVMTLEEYKKKVLQCLMENCNFTEEAAKKYLTIYSEDFPEFIEKKFTPAEAAMAIVMGY